MPLPPVNRKLRQLRRIRLKVAGMPFIDDGNGIGAGVGADNAAKLEHDQRTASPEGEAFSRGCASAFAPG